MDNDPESMLISAEQWSAIVRKQSKTRAILMRVIKEREELKEYLNRIATFADLDWDTEKPFPIDELFERIYT